MHIGQDVDKTSIFCALGYSTLEEGGLTRRGKTDVRRMGENIRRGKINIGREVHISGSMCSTGSVLLGHHNWYHPCAA